jgi:hypothetical protein
MNFLFLFLDGVGLGTEDPEINPLASAKMPYLRDLLNGHGLDLPLETESATLLAIDSIMGVDGIPQSATGQASLLCGKNVPKLIGRHYGPKPNQEIRDIINAENIFSNLTKNNKKAALLNAYPQGYFDNINSGKRLYSAIPQAVSNSSLKLMHTDDLYAGRALAADFTGEGWRTHLGFTDSPVMDEFIAGEKLAELAGNYDFAFFEYWPSDYAGHRQDRSSAISLLESFDTVLGGLLNQWDDKKGLILITSDHGNLEDVSTRRHTLNPVPALVIGSYELRRKFTQNLKDLSDVFSAVIDQFE